MNDLDHLSDQWLAEANAAAGVRVDPSVKPQPPAFAQTYMKGDSYPPTTSGAPSVSEKGARNDGKSSHDQSTIAAAQNGQPRSGLNRGSGQRSRFIGANSRPGAEPERVQQQAAVAAQYHRPSTGKSSRLSSPVSEDFSYMPAGNKQNFAPPQATHGQQHPNHDPNKDRQNLNAPVRKDAPLEVRKSVPRGPQVPQASDPVNRRAAAVERQHRDDDNVPASPHRPHKKNMAMPAPPCQQEYQSDDYPPEGDEDEMHFENHFDENKDEKSLVQSDDDKPDHELEELYAMDYQALRAAVSYTHLTLPTKRIV